MFVIPKKKRLEPQSCDKDQAKGCEKMTAQLRSPTDEEVKLITGNFIPALSDKRLRKYFKIENILMVENPSLVDKFQAFKNTLRGIRQSEQTLGYLLVNSNAELTKIVNFGLSVESSIFNDFGKIEQGVTVHQFVDQVTPAPFFNNIKQRILCFKTLRGKTKKVAMDSTNLCALREFNSLGFSSTYDRQLTPLEKFRSSTVFFYEFGANGTPMTTPSGLLPFAVYDLVPTYGSNHINSISPNRLRLSCNLMKSAYVNLSSGMFAGSRCIFSAPSVHEREPTVANICSLHLREQFYEWNMLLKLPVFVALMQPNNWGKLTESEIQIKVDDTIKYYVSYWTFWNESPSLAKIISWLQLNRLCVVGCCGDTTLFLFPNGQFSSVLGLPHNDGSLLHCVAVDCEHSVLGTTSESLAAQDYESTISTTYRDGVAYFVSAQLFHQRRVDSLLNITLTKDAGVTDLGCSIPPGNQKEVENIHFAPDSESTKDANHERRNGNMNDVYAHQWIPLKLYQEQYKSRSCEDADLERGTTLQNTSVLDTRSNLMPGLGLVDSSKMEADEVDMEIAEQSEDEDFIDPFDKDYDLLCNSSLLADPIKAQENNLCVDQKPACDTISKEEVPVKLENINGKLFPSCSSEANLVKTNFSIESLLSNFTTQEPNFKNSIWTKKDNELSEDLEENPILKSVVNYVKAGPAPKPYNGSLELGYTEAGDARVPLLPSTPQKITSRADTHEKGHSPYMDVASLQYTTAVLKTESEVKRSVLSVQNVQAGVKRDLSKPLIIIIDSDIVYERLKPADFTMLLRRLAVDKIVNNLGHKLLYHRFIEEDFCRKILHNETSEEQSVWMIEYLKLFKEYELQKIAVKMDPHRCDTLKQTWTPQDKIRCLRYSIASVRRWNPSVNIVYLADLKDCAIQDSFKDPNIRFIDYSWWINIF